MKLFWKLSVVLGLAMTVALVAALSMGWQIGQQTVAQFSQTENREPVLERASQALYTGGREGLTAWLRQNETPTTGWMLLVVDERGNDLLDREIPDYWQGLLRFSMGRTRWGSFGAEPNRRDRQQFDELIAPTGEVFRFVFVPTRITVLNFLSIPTTQLGVVAIAVIMAVATALLLARSFASPIVRLQRATRGLAAGALDTRVGEPFVSRKDEIGTLARDFDAMAARVQALITDKEVLIRDVSHELRSPLARIRVALALAQRKTDAAAQGDLSRIEQETEKLDQLVGQILTLARLRSSPLDQFVSIQFDELVQEVVGNTRFEHPDVPIVWQANAKPMVRGNASEMASAIENVLRNAVLHSGSDADVGVELKQHGNEIWLTISDNGPGVPDDELAHLFEPFYRVDPSRDHKTDGYGLGLAIAARVIERHGGNIEAKNRPDGGLAVTFRLPAQRSH